MTAAVTLAGRGPEPWDRAAEQALMNEAQFAVERRRLCPGHPRLVRAGRAVLAAFHARSLPAMRAAVAGYVAVAGMLPTGEYNWNPGRHRGEKTRSPDGTTPGADHTGRRWPAGGSRGRGVDPPAGNPVALPAGGRVVSTATRGTSREPAGGSSRGAGCAGHGPPCGNLGYWWGATDRPTDATG